MGKKINKEVERFNPSINEGLSSTQVKQRNQDRLNNFTKIVVGKTYGEIIFTNVFSFFNIVLFVITGLIIFAGNYTGLFFLVVLIPNIIIGLYEDIKARHLMGKLRVITAPKVNVIRDGQEKEILTSELVLDDITYLTPNRQICADSIVLEGTIAVNESLLTGEPDNIYKQPGDIIYSGSYVVSGKAYARVDKIGKNSYIETVQGQAKKFKRSRSEILKSLKYLFRVIGVLVTILGVTTVLLYYFKGQLNTVEDAKRMIRPLSGSLVSMIPSGLYLLTSLALAVGVITLSKKKAQVQDFYSIEMLSRTNVLCVDKTGTITDGTMQVSEVIPLEKYSKDELETLISNIIRLIGDDNSTAKAMLDYFTLEATMKSKKVLPFNSQNKYSGVTLSNGKTYVMGAAEFLNIKSKNTLISKINKYASKGLRVIVIGESSSSIKGNEFKDELTAIAIVVLQDHIKEDAYETFKWFKENNVAIKVISGDNAATVSEIAKQVGIDNSEQYISLEGMSDEDVADAANTYTVFGRVTPEQKAILIKAMKNGGNTVAMTGDGVNDILALKSADCSIAMASGADSAKNVSHIVLLDSNFSRLPDVVGEGRRVVNNLQRTSSLFLVKTIFAVVMTITFIILSFVNTKIVSYPFSTNNMYMWEMLAIGLASFFLALEKNKERISGGFLSNVFKKALPAGIIICLITGIFFLFYFLQKSGVYYFGINDLGFATSKNAPVTGATAMAVIAFTLFGFIVLAKVCYPFDKYRAIVYGGVILIGVIATSIFVWQSFTYPEHNNLLQIDFTSLSSTNYLIILAVVIGFSALHLFIAFLIDRFGGKHHDKD